MPARSSLLAALSTRNVGALDRVLRAIPFPAVVYMLVTGQLTGTLAWILGAASAMLFVTAVSGSCSIYYMLGFSTCPISGKPRR